MKTPDPLNTALRRWSTRQAPPEAHFAQLQKNISARAVEWRYHARLTESPPWGLAVMARLSYALLGALLVVVIGGLFQVNRANGRRAAADRQAAAMLASIPAQKLASAQALFHETQQMFAKRVRWITETDKDVDVQVEPTDSMPANSAPVFMRLTVVSRKKGGKVWTSIWNSDVLIRGEDQVQIAPDRQAGNHLTAWVYPLADGKVMVETNLKLDLPVRIGSSIRNVVEQGVPTEMASLNTEDSEYRVFQTVQVMKAG